MMPGAEVAGLHSEDRGGPQVTDGGGHEKLQKSKKTDSPLLPPERTSPANTLTSAQWN